MGEGAVEEMNVTCNYLMLSFFMKKDSFRNHYSSVQVLYLLCSFGLLFTVFRIIHCLSESLLYKQFVFGNHIMLTAFNY